MSTGVDNKQQPQKFIDLDSVARHRSVSRNNGSAVPLPVHGQVSDKQLDKMVSQSQKSRWLKTGAIVGLIFMVLLWLSPSNTAVSSFTKGMHRISLPARSSGNEITNNLSSV